MSVVELRENWCPKVFILEIGGIGTGVDPVRYYSGPPPPSKTDTGSGKSYVDVEAIVNVSDLVFDTTTTRATFQPITITLQKDEFAPGPNDPSIVLEREGWRHTSYARLITTLESALLGVNIEMDRDPAATFGAFPRALSIGRETIWATGTAGAGTAGNPWRVTGVVRGIRDTIPLTHYVGSRATQRPFITGEVVFWQRRRAILYAAHRRLDGSVGDYAEVMRGELVGPPDGTSETRTTVVLSPVDAVLDRRISSDGRSVGLRHGYHYFEGSAANTVEIAQSWPEGHAYTTTANGATAAAASPVLVHSTAGHNDNFDLTLPAGHPRRGAVHVASGDTWDPTGYVGGLQVAAADNVNGVVAFDRLTNAIATELITVPLITPSAGTTALLEWPKALFDALHVATAWQPGSRDGLAGAWADMALTDDGARGYRIRVEYNPDALGAQASRVGPMRLYMWSSTAAWPPEWGPLPRSWTKGTPVGVSGAELLHYGLCLASQDLNAIPPPLKDFSGRPGAWRDGQWARAIDIHRNTTVDDSAPVIFGIADAFYQSGELYITADGDIPIPVTLGSTAIRVEHTDAVTGDRVSFSTRIQSSTSLGSGAWALELSNDLLSRGLVPSFGDWPGRERATISPTIKERPNPPATAIPRLLLSISGNGVGHPQLDVLPFGGELTEDDVNIGTFNDYPPPPGLDRWSIAIPPDGSVLGDIIEPMAEVMGAIITTERDEQGLCRLRLASVGPPTEVERVTDSIDAGDWMITPPPRTMTDSRITNVRTYLTDHDDDGEGDAQGTFHFYDSASISAHGRGDRRDIELRGIRIRDNNDAEALAALGDVDARLQQLEGYTRKVWRARTSTGRGWLLYPGAVVRVSSPHLKGFSDTRGVTNALARVKAGRIRMWGDGADLELVHYGNKSTGWNASAKVSVVVSPTVVEVEANAFSNTTHPITGAALLDIDGFEGSSNVRCVPFGDHDNAVVRAIAASGIDRALRRITFTAAHGLAVGDYIEPETYDNATTDHQGWAYLADAAGTLGAAADAGYELV